MARNNYVQVYGLQVRKGGKPTGTTVKRYRAFWYDAAGTKHGKVFAVRRDAQAFIDGKTTDRGVGRLADHNAGAITVKALQDDYLEANRERWADNTFTMYGLAWKHVPPAFRATAVRDVTVPMVDAILAGVKAPAMRQKLRQLLSGMFKRAVHDGRIAVSPVQALGLHKTKAEMLAGTGKGARVLTLAELKRLADATDPRYQVLVEVLGRVGLRPSEAYGLTVGQFDPMGRTLTVDRTLRGMGTKTGKGRVVPISADLVDKLIDFVGRYSDMLDPAALVFPANDAGQPINDNNWRRREFKDAITRSGLTPPALRVYDLRHTACSNALAAGVDPATVANMSGHNVDTLLATYAHPVMDRAVAAAERLADAWAKAPAPQTILDNA